MDPGGQAGSDKSNASPGVKRTGRPVEDPVAPGWRALRHSWGAVDYRKAAPMNLWQA